MTSRLFAIALAVPLSAALVTAARPARPAAPQPQPQPPAGETCGVVSVITNCTAGFEIQSTGLTARVRIPSSKRSAFPPIKSTYLGAQLCVAATPPKPGKSFTVDVADPSEIRMLSPLPPAPEKVEALDPKTPGLVPPRAIKSVSPKYVTQGRRPDRQGPIELEGVVLADGTVSELRVTKGIDPCGLDDEALIAVKQWRYSPALLNGQPVAVKLHVTVSFFIR